MALRPCPECSRKISTAAVSCPHCGYVPTKEERTEWAAQIRDAAVPPRVKPPQQSNKTFLLTLLGIILALVILAFLADGFSGTAPTPKRTAEKALAAEREITLYRELDYLNQIAEVSWFEVEGNNVYIGFNRRPTDLKMVLRGAALRGNRAINFGVHAWGVRASQTGWRPGDGPFYGEATARYGRVK